VTVKPTEFEPFMPMVHFEAPSNVELGDPIAATRAQRDESESVFQDTTVEARRLLSVNREVILRALANLSFLQTKYDELINQRAVINKRYADLERQLVDYFDKINTELARADQCELMVYGILGRATDDGSAERERLADWRDSEELIALNKSARAIRAAADESMRDAVEKIRLEMATLKQISDDLQEDSTRILKDISEVKARLMQDMRDPAEDLLA
jgi:hypothetical protein